MITGQKTWRWALFAMAISILGPACSIPNLEAPECTDSRGVAKEFYSVYFGNDRKIPEQFPVENFMTPELRSSPANSGVDPYTLAEDNPVAFRIGECKVLSPSQTAVQVLLFWRDDVRSEQKEISVEFVKVNDAWLINRIKR